MVDSDIEVSGMVASHEPFFMLPWMAVTSHSTFQGLSCILSMGSYISSERLNVSRKEAIVQCIDLDDL